MSQTLDLQISKANLEAALTDTILRQLGFIPDGVEVDHVELSVTDQTPLTIKYKELVN